jgi:hypothetical protein
MKLIFKNIIILEEWNELIKMSKIYEKMSFTYLLVVMYVYSTILKKFIFFWLN